MPPLPGEAEFCDRLLDQLAVDIVPTHRQHSADVAQVPPGYVRQLALYRALLAKIYPGRPVRAALLWTDVPELMELSAERLDAEIAALTAA